MTVIHAKDTCAMCGNYLDDDLKCYECPDCNPHSTEDAFEIFTGEYGSNKRKV